jgi:tetratricopeptide (TPR) repeat protein
LILNAGSTYFAKGNNERALEKYNDLLIHSMLLNNSKYQFLAIFNSGNVENAMGNYGSAVEYFKYSLKLATKMNNKKYIFSSLMRLGSVNYVYGDYENGKFYSLKAVLMAKNLKDIEGVANASINACLNYDLLGKTELAKIYCERGLRINNSLTQIIGRPEYSLQNGKTINWIGFLKDNQVANTFFQDAFDLSNAYNLELLKLASIKGLFDIEKNRGYLNDYLVLKDKIGISWGGCDYCNIVMTDLHEGKSRPALENALLFLGGARNKFEVSTLALLISDMYRDRQDFSNARRYAVIALNNYEKMYKENHYLIKNAKNLLIQYGK